MNTVPVIRYAPGGDIYETLANQYGTAGAQKVYNAALTGDRGAITEALAMVRSGPPLNDSTAEIFLEQISKDPFAAPLESLNNQVGKIFGNLFKNPFALIALALVSVVIIDAVFKTGILSRLLGKFLK